MPRVRCLLPLPGDPLLPGLADLARVTAAPGWRRQWRPRALPAVMLHAAVPGLAVGPGFELLGDRRGPGWLEILPCGTTPRAAERRLQLVLEITRRPWGLLAALPDDACAAPLLVERPRDPLAGRRLAAAAALALARAARNRAGAGVGYRGASP